MEDSGQTGDAMDELPFHLESRLRRKAQNMNIEAEVDIKISVTPENLAKMFCQLDHEEMADFFNHVWNESKKWGEGDLKRQITSVQKSEVLAGGHALMRMIGDFTLANLR